MRESTDGIEIDDDPQRLDRDVIWGFLSTEAYWGRQRSRADVETQIDNAWRVVAAYVDGPLVGFARAVADGVAVGYLADVFVLAPYRGRGIAQALVRTLVEEGPGARFRWMLHTRDAHDLYRRFGFAEPDETMLERPSPRRRASGAGQ